MFTSRLSTHDFTTLYMASVTLTSDAKLIRRTSARGGFCGAGGDATWVLAGGVETRGVICSGGDGDGDGVDAVGFVPSAIAFGFFTTAGLLVPNTCKPGSSTSSCCCCLFIMFIKSWGFFMICCHVGPLSWLCMLTFLDLWHGTCARRWAGSGKMYLRLEHVWRKQE